MKQVTPEEWKAIHLEQQERYKRIQDLIRETEVWPGEDEIGGAIAVVVHTAYHLDEIHQALCLLRA